MYERHQTGKTAEDQALEWFTTKRKATLIARNFRCRWGEIDLIFLDNDELVFIEVRARASKGWVNGAESVTPAKQRRLKKTADYFLNSYKGKAKSVRFDLLAWDGTTWTYIPNLWF